MTVPTLYEDEARIKRCSFSSTQGAGVTLELPSMEAMQRFLGNEGKRVALVAILIGDDEAPVAPKVKEPRKRSARAFLLCGDANFRQWASRNGMYDADFGGADAFIKDECAIASKSELDSNLAAADAFDLMCVDFNEWMESRR